MTTTMIPESLVRAGGDAMIEALGMVPMRDQHLRRVDFEAALNLLHRWKRLPFYPAPATDQPGRAAARLRKSYRRLYKRLNAKR